MTLIYYLIIINNKLNYLKKEKKEKRALLA
jgi:hypothetical protein